MTSPNDFNLLGFFATPSHRCSYLDREDAVTVFADPEYPKDTPLYSILTRHGFRRSGQHIYRPHCEACHACIPVRIPVSSFSPSRNQRRTWNRNSDLQVSEHAAGFSQEHFALYQRYLDSRHTGGGMDDPTPNQYMEFLTSQWSDTLFFEFRQRDELLAVAVVDQLDDALSAVYTFYDPAWDKRSLGTYVILWEIEKARDAGLHWLYLGYWIEGCQKMSYKSRFQPLEYLHDGSWSKHPG